MQCDFSRHVHYWAVSSPILSLSRLTHSSGVDSPPAVLLLDEPTAACDAEACALVERAIVGSGLTVMIITHDKAQAERISHRRLLIATL